MARLITVPPLGQAHPLSGFSGWISGFKEVRNFRELIYEVIDYLDVSSEKHLRYRDLEGTTFCNVYAYDVCFLLGFLAKGIYLPRVWWKDEAAGLIASGVPLRALYNQTVEELNCNKLFFWFAEFGQGFGWCSMTGVSALQEEVNQGVGSLGVIISRNAARRGHIALVIPEWADRGAEFTALWGSDGTLISPLQSQAGSRNIKYGHCLLNGECWFEREDEFAIYYFNAKLNSGNG